MEGTFVRTSTRLYSTIGDNRNEPNVAKSVESAGHENKTTKKIDLEKIEDVDEDSEWDDDGDSRGSMVAENLVRTAQESTLGDLEDIVSLLTSSHCRDVVTIDVRRRSDHVDYMVIATCMAMRHIKSVSASLSLKFKERRRQGDRLTIEGEPDTKWMVVNMSDVQIHLMEEGLRKRYELEKLWTLGRDDDQLRAMGDNTTIMNDKGF
eukprot:CFRG8406T1